MTKDNVADAVATLKDYLERERVAALRADFETLERIASEKAGLLAIFQSLDVSKKDLHELQKLLSRNEKLLEASANGVRTVSRKLAALRSAKSSIKTYSAKGQQEVIATDASKVEWRA